MKKIFLIVIVCLVALVGSLAYNIDRGSDRYSRMAVEQKTPEEAVVVDKYKEIEHMFDLVKKDPVVGDNWATEVFPGDERDSRMIKQSLMATDDLRRELEKLPPSERYPDLKHEVELFMAHEATNLLVAARRDQDLEGLETFLRFASRMDTSPDTFGVSPDQLRNEALIMAKKEIVILRPRLREGSGDARVYLQHIIRAWRFTPSQLGLTKEDMKEVADK
jgi:hypothetical protein